MLMFGLVLTVGMLVDGAIVMIEFADRKMAEGVAKQQAYVQAAQRMFWPIVSSTATTLAAFLPMLLWPGVAGDFMGYLPLTVIVVLSASLLTAMIFLPTIGSIFGKADKANSATAARLAADGDGKHSRPSRLYRRLHPVSQPGRTPPAEGACWCC
jgi:multidrug efflux pump